MSLNFLSLLTTNRIQVFLIGSLLLHAGLSALLFSFSTNKNNEPIYLSVSLFSPNLSQSGGLGSVRKTKVIKTKNNLKSSQPEPISNDISNAETVVTQSSASVEQIGDGFGTSDVDLSQSTDPQAGIYLGELSELLNRFKSYPQMAKQLGIEGLVKLLVTVDTETGEIKSIKTLHADHKILEQSAVNTIRRISKFPKLPIVLSSQTFNITIPMNYKFK